MARTSKATGNNNATAAKQTLGKAKEKSNPEDSNTTLRKSSVKGSAAQKKPQRNHIENPPIPDKNEPGKPRKKAASAPKTAQKKNTALRMNMDEDRMDIDDGSDPVSGKQASLPESQKGGGPRGTKRRRDSNSSVSTKPPSKRLQVRKVSEIDDKAPVNVPNLNLVQLYTNCLRELEPINPSGRWLGKGPPKGFEFDENGNIVEVEKKEQKTERQRAAADNFDRGGQKLEAIEKSMLEAIEKRETENAISREAHFAMMVKQRIAYLEQVLNRGQLLRSLVKNVRAVIEAYKRDGRIIPHVKKPEDMTSEEVLEDIGAKKPGGYGDDYTYWFDGKQITRYQARTWRTNMEVWMEEKSVGPSFACASSFLNSFIPGRNLPANKDFQVLSLRPPPPPGHKKPEPRWDLGYNYLAYTGEANGKMGVHIISHEHEFPEGTHIKGISIDDTKWENYTAENWGDLFARPDIRAGTAEFAALMKVYGKMQVPKEQRLALYTPRMTMSEYPSRREEQDYRYDQDYITCSIAPSIGKTYLYHFDVACRFHPSQADRIINNPKPIVLKMMFDTGSTIPLLPLSIWNALLRRWKPHSTGISQGRAVLADNRSIEKSIVKLQFRLIQSGFFVSDWFDSSAMIPVVRDDGTFDADDMADFTPLSGTDIHEAMNWLLLKDRKELIVCSHLKSIDWNIDTGVMPKLESHIRNQVTKAGVKAYLTSAA